MKDRRPPRKGAPPRGPKGAGGPRFRSETGDRGPARGPREDDGRPRGKPRFGGPRPPRESFDEGERRFDRPTDGSFRKPRFDRGARADSRDAGPRFPKSDGFRTRQGADDERAPPRRGRQERQDSPRQDRRFERDDAGRRRGGGEFPRGGAGDRSSYSARPPNGQRRDDRVPRDENDGGRQARDDRRGGFRRGRNGDDDSHSRAPFDRAENPRHRRDRGEPHEARETRALDRGGKPRPGAERRIVGRDKARRAQSIGEDGALWLYGKHAVAAALANPARKIKRLLAAEGALAWLAEAGIDKERASTAEQTSTAEIDLLLHPGAVHQGLAALVEDLPRARLREECAPDEKGGPAVVLDQITDPQNIGAIMRSAAAFGAKAVIVQDRRTPPLAGALAKAAAGAVEVIPCVKVVNVARAIEGLKDLGYYCAGLAGEATTPISDIPKDRPVALVLGAEGEGLRRLVAETCDGLYKIPIEGAVESLNVSTAAAVSLFAVTR